MSRLLRLTDGRLASTETGVDIRRDTRTDDHADATMAKLYCAT